MPVAHPPSPPQSPAPLTPDEAGFIKSTVERYFGNGAVVRNYGSDPSRLQLHVESDLDIGSAQYDCAGELLAHIEREQITLVTTTRGRRVFGDAKIAYRQGVII